MTFNYKPKYAVTVICKDEKEQQRIYEEFKKQGYKCRVVVV